METLDITIIGAGVVGLAIAERLSKRVESIAVIEKHDSFGRETSSRNSEVIHDGSHYPQNSLKAQLSVEGNRMLYEICLDNQINHKKTGKLTVAVTDEEISRLEAFEKNGQANGVQDLIFYEPAQIKKLEPLISARLGLYSPHTGIIDSHGLMKYFATKAESQGALIVYHSEVTSIKKVPHGFLFTVNHSDGTIDEFTTKILINSAGLYSDKIAEMAGIDSHEAGYKLHFCKGDYMAWNKQGLSHLVYPLPTQYSKGIHACIDLNNDIRFGPNAYYVNEVNYDVASKKEEFFKAVRYYLPDITINDLSPAMSGVRPKLQSENEKFRDFIITHESDRGLSGLINLIGIESPGLTAAPAIARYVDDMTKSI